MSDYERGYEMGLEDGHRCEKRHATIAALEAERDALKAQLRKAEEEAQYQCRYASDIESDGARHLANLTEERDALKAQLTAVEAVRDEYYAQYIDATESEDRLRGQITDLTRKLEEANKAIQPSTRNNP